MKPSSLFLSILVAVSVPHAFEPAIETIPPDTVVKSVTMPINPVLARVLGWSLATTGFVMATSGTGLLGDNDGCALIQGFNCDRDQQQRQFFLLGGGALLGSVGAILIWGSEVAHASPTGQSAYSEGAPPVAPQSPKNMWVGMGLGLAGSAAGTMLIWNDPSVAMVMLGIVTPSLGQAYAGSTPGMVASLMVRGLGGFMLAKNYMDCRFADECDPNYTIGRTLFVTGVAISLYDTWSSIRRSEGQARTESASTFSLSPALFPVGHGRLVPGLAFNASW